MGDSPVLSPSVGSPLRQVGKLPQFPLSLEQLIVPGPLSHPHKSPEGEELLLCPGSWERWQHWGQDRWHLRQSWEEGWGTDMALSHCSVRPWDRCVSSTRGTERAGARDSQVPRRALCLLPPPARGWVGWTGWGKVRAGTRPSHHVVFSLENLMPGTRPMRLTVRCKRLLPVSTFTALPMVVLSRLSPFTSVILSPTHRPARSAPGEGVSWHGPLGTIPPGQN